MLAVKLNDRFLCEWAGKADSAQAVCGRQFWVDSTLETRRTSLLVDDSKTFVLTVWVDFWTRLDLSVDHFWHLLGHLFQSFPRLNWSYTVTIWLNLSVSDRLLCFFSPRSPLVLYQCSSEFLNFSCCSWLWSSEISDDWSRTTILVHTIRIVSCRCRSDPVNSKARAQVDRTWLQLHHSFHFVINCVFVFTICIGTHAFIMVLRSSYQVNNLKWQPIIWNLKSINLN